MLCIVYCAFLSPHYPLSLLLDTLLLYMHSSLILRSSHARKHKVFVYVWLTLTWWPAVLSTFLQVIPFHSSLQTLCLWKSEHACPGVSGCEYMTMCDWLCAHTCAWACGIFFSHVPIARLPSCCVCVCVWLFVGVVDVLPSTGMSRCL